MNKPNPKPWLVRKLLYYYQALAIPKIIFNWDFVAREYFGQNDKKTDKIIKLHNGLRFKIGHFLDVWAIKEVIGENDYRLRPNRAIKTVVDIGANTGTFSVLAALTFENAVIYAFEPSSSTFALLKHNLKVNGVSRKVVPTRQAVFSRVKKLKLYNAGPSGIRSLFQSRGETNFETVTTTTLPNIIKRFRLKRIDYLKIDCEGAEYDIFRSLKKQNWQKIDRLALEFHELVPGQDHRELLAILKSNNFKTEAGYHPIENSIGYIYAWT